MIYASDYDETWEFLSPDQQMETEFIITGNPYDQYSRLYDDGVRIPVFWNPGKKELMEIINHKVNVLNKTKADVFYEDQEIQVQFLKALCPKTKIILIKGEA